MSDASTTNVNLGFSDISNELAQYRADVAWLGHVVSLQVGTVANDAKTSIEAMRNDILAKMNKVKSKANKMSAEGQKNLASWNAKIDDPGVATTELKEKLAALQSAVDGIVDRMDASASKDLENAAVKADGQLDVVSILKQLQMFELKVAGHNDRINALENKETVRELALSNIRDKLGEFERQTQEASVLLAKCAGDGPLIPFRNTVIALANSKAQ